MVIFRIIFNLIRLGLRLLLLPIFILSRNLFLVILLVIIVVIYMAFQDATPPSQVTPGSAVQREQPRSKSSEILIEAVRKREDGNSAFSTDLYAMMTPEEQGYYSQIFFWAMTNLPSGQSHAWVNGNTNGTFTPVDSFRNNSGATCRRFREVLKVRSIEQSISGLACSRTPAGSWCKLQATATPACGLGGKPGFWESIKGMFR